MDLRKFEDRKRDHIRHALDGANQASGRGGLDSVELIHEALPDLDFEEVSLRSTCLGEVSETPFYVAAMTAGHGDAPRLNEQLARACARRGWALGVGSQRRELEEIGSRVDLWADLRSQVPRLRLIANVGISQLRGAPRDALVRIVDGMQATALAVHANALQEGLQLEGTPQFGGALATLERLCESFPVPVLLKETGCGFSLRTLERISQMGLAAVDVSGLGGTHWGRIEGARAAGESSRRARILARAAQTFKDWGVPTVDSVLNARRAFGAGPLETWASGGVRSGLDAAKLVALGAVQVGFARPALEAAQQGDEALDEWMEQMELEYRLALFCMGARSGDEIRGRETAWKRRDS